MTDRFRPGQVVKLKNGNTARIHFTGHTEFADGDWLGVAFEEPLGKNDGSVRGKRYFECEPQHGMFIRPEMAESVPGELEPTEASTTTNSAVTAPKLRQGAALNGGRRAGSLDPAASKRLSLNSASPTPGGRGKPAVNGRPSPAKPASRQMPSTLASNSTSTRGTPGLGASRSNHPRPSPGSSRLSISSTNRGPPPPASATHPTRPSLGTSLTARGSKTASRPMLPKTSASVNERPSRPAEMQSLSKPPNGRAIIRRQTKSDECNEEETIAREASSSAEPDQNERDDLECQNGQPQKMNGHIELGQVYSSTEYISSMRANKRSASKAASSTREMDDLHTRLRIQEKQRDEDKERLRTLEKLQTERDRFESIIQKLQSKLHPQQQELSDLRKQIKEREAKLEELETIQAEHDSLMEMATLDREMAEEQADALRTELDVLRPKFEELELEAEILRGENEELGRDMNPEERSSQGWLQLERESQRYRDALVRLRDVTQDKEAELTEEIVSLQDDVKHMNITQEQYNEAKEKLRQSEAAVEDLRQQLDAALGAEEMLEELTEKNLALTEQIDDLKLNIEDLENLKELNDELEVNHVEAEKQMQDELDFKDSLLGEQSRYAAQQDENLAHYEYTTSKFRELVANLQGHIEDLKASQQLSEAEAEELNSRSKAMTDLNLKLQNSATKTQINTIDLELRRLEAEEAIEHLAIIQMFLPESFKTERDSVLAYLRFRRIAAKSRILHSSLKAKQSSEASPRPSDEAFVVCDVLDKLIWISKTCDRFLSKISTCGLEQFAKYETALYELEPVERGLNNQIKALKKGEMKQRSVAEELQRSKALLMHLSEIYVTIDNIEDYVEDMIMRASIIQSYLESSSTAMAYTRACIPGPNPDESTDESTLNDLTVKVDTFLYQSRSVKVIAAKVIHSLEELKTRSMSLSSASSQDFEDCQDLITELASLIRQLGEYLHQTKNIETENMLSMASFRSQLSEFCSQYLPNTTYTEPFSVFHQKISLISSKLSHILDLATSLKSIVEFSRSPAPWELRSEELKKSSQVHFFAEEELGRLKHDIHERVAQLRLRDQTLEEQSVKIELLESRTRDANAKANRITELQRAVEAGKSRERELAGAMETQMREAYTLQSERDRWKRVADERQAAISPGEQEKGERKERTVATVREVESLRLEIDGLQGAVRFLHDDNHRARLGNPKEEYMAWLWTPLMQQSPNDGEHRKRKELKKEGIDVLDSLLDLVNDAQFVDLGKLPKNKLSWRPAKEKNAWLCERQREIWTMWSSRLRNFCDKGFYELRMADGERDAQVFPYVSKALQEYDATKPSGGDIMNGAAKQPRPSAFDSGVAGLEDGDIQQAVSAQDERQGWGSRLDIGSAVASFVPRI